jgi:hypothetical protein
MVCLDIGRLECKLIVCTTTGASPIVYRHTEMQTDSEYSLVDRNKVV